jgi:GLPGLI family protein
MRTTTFLLLSITLVLSAQAQTKVILSARYDIRYTQNGKVLLNDECRLLVTTTMSYFYSLNKIRYRAYLEKKFATATQNGGKINFSAEESNMLVNFLPFAVLKNYRQDQSVFIEEVEDQTFGYIKDTTLRRRWILSPDTMTINNLFCHKASYRTKDSLEVTAWYTTAVAVGEGPFSYYGLPGLIVSVKNNRGWSSELIGFDDAAAQKWELPAYMLTTEAKLAVAKENNRRMLLGKQTSGVKTTLEKKKDE